MEICQDILSQALNIKKKINSIVILETELQREEVDPSFYSQIDTHSKSVNNKNGALNLFLNYRPGKIQFYQVTLDIFVSIFFIRYPTITENGNFILRI